ncbi:glucarate dehydratase, partial [Streptomyces sp. NPDC057623]
SFIDGSVPVPRGPGLGVELDRAGLDRLHAAYLELGREHRNDAAYLRSVRPDFDPRMPRW